MSFKTNPQLEQAFEYVYNTSKNIFLTGKAGTGKTTFLHQIKKDALKRMVVVAPTGVAAINAGGMTIHSFFQLSFGLFLPGSKQDPDRQRRFTRDKINLIRSLDLLVIDEISMVRADILDAIDEVLCRYRANSRPFGGVQLLMIGDLHQLPPVVKEDDWEQLRYYYDTQYFFSSKALQRTEPISIELKHIYRQSDETFIHLLNKVRDNKIDQQVLETLNSRYIPNFEPKNDEPYITLTSHNAVAQDINFAKLTKISGKATAFKAVIKGDFPEKMYPNDEVLEFKVGAQVMFVKNELGQERRYYNGKIGTITEIKGDAITVRCPGDENTITVPRVDWENIKYTLNEKTKEVSEEIVGSFSQIPLKLAWAITIHKSQGLTFERAVIDAQSAFAHGQVYVALSRCKSFEGIVLRSKIEFSSVKTDIKVKNYSEEAERNIPDEMHLKRSKALFQQSLIRELFGFSTLKKLLDKGFHLFVQHENTLHASGFEQFQAFDKVVQHEISSTADKFGPQLTAYFEQDTLPEENTELMGRMQKAALWFSEKLETATKTLTAIPVETDNKAVQTEVLDLLKDIELELFIKNACFKTAQKAFSTAEFLRVRANAELDFKMLARQPKPISEVPAKVAVQTAHPKLYLQLKKWRADMAEMSDIELYAVLPTKVMTDIVNALPTNKADLARIKGIGTVKLKQFGDELIQMIRDYCADNHIATDAPPELDLFLPKVSAKPDTKKVSFDLYQSGKSIEDIATERGLVKSTIEGHLAHYVGTGDLDIFDLVDKQKVLAIEEFFNMNETTLASEAKLALGDAVSYTDIRLVRERWEAARVSVEMES